MSVCGGWSLERQERGDRRVITLFCRAWSCPDCMPRRLRALKREAADGNPSTFMTLTVNPAHGQNPVDRARELVEAFRTMIKRARRKFTKTAIEYLAVFEETKRHEPHLHVILRAPYIPQKWLSDTMAELIRAPIVDIRRVGSKAGVARYVAKYVAKGPKAFGSLKRYWRSPGYALTPRPRPARGADGESFWSVCRLPAWMLIGRYRLAGYDVHAVSDAEWRVCVKGAGGINGTLLHLYDSEGV